MTSAPPVGLRVAAYAVVAAVALASAVLSFRVLRQLTPLGSHALGTVTGWAPLGGLLVLAAAVRLWRGRPGGRDRIATVVQSLMVAAWLGWAFPYFPARGGAFSSWHEDVQRGGDAFAGAATAMTYALGVTVVWAVVLLTLSRRTSGWRGWDRGGLEALVLAPPALVALLVSLVR